MNGVCYEAQAGSAHHDDLEHPVPYVRNGESLVITSLVAAWLQRVTDKHRLLVIVHRLPYNGHNENSEDHHHGQQDPATEKPVSARRRRAAGSCPVLTGPRPRHGHRPGHGHRPRRRDPAPAPRSGPGSARGTRRLRGIASARPCATERGRRSALAPARPLRPKGGHTGPGVPGSTAGKGAGPRRQRDPDGSGVSSTTGRCPMAPRGQGRRRLRCPRASAPRAAYQPPQHTHTNIEHTLTHTHSRTNTNTLTHRAHASSRHSPKEPGRRAPRTSRAAGSDRRGSPLRSPDLSRDPYLPIIVECCCTAASSSLSRIVHSPIAVHPETKTLASVGDLFTSAFFTPPIFFFFFRGRENKPKSCPSLLPAVRWREGGWRRQPCRGFPARFGSALRGSGPLGSRLRPGPLGSWRGAAGGPAAWREEGWL